MATQRRNILARIGVLAMLAALLVGSLGRPGGAGAAAGVVLFHLDGATNRYTDRAGAQALLGTAQFSTRGRAFGARMPAVAPAKDSRLSPAAFPYGAYGIDGQDADGDGYGDPGDVDPATLLDAMKADGVYNVALSSNLGDLGPGKIEYTLDAAYRRNVKLLVRAFAYVDKTFNVDVAGTDRELAKFQDVFSRRPELQSVIYAWYGYDEPAIKFEANPNAGLLEMQKLYKLYKSQFATIPVFTVFSQNQSTPDGPDLDSIGDGLLGQPRNPYSASIADIVGLNVYTALEDYGYNAISNVYTHARRVVNQQTPGIPIWAVAQAHGKATAPGNLPEPHHLYRQANDWFRAGPDAGLRGVDGWLWYSWHFREDSPQRLSDLENSPANRDMARSIGQQIQAGSVVTHKLPYRSELYAPQAPASAIRFPRANHLNLPAGTVTLAFTHPWKGDDGVRHVLLDTGASVTTNRLVIEKTAGNVLQATVYDSAGGQKYAGTRVNSYNMPGITTLPGYSEVAVTWSNGALELYLDGVSGGVGGGTGTGKLSSAGVYVYLGSDLSGKNGANGTFSYVTVRDAAGTAAEVSAWGKYSYLSSGAPAPALSSPAAGAATADRIPTLRWLPGATPAKYQVQLSTSSSFASIARDATVTGGEYTTPTSLAPGTYYWRVRSLDDYGPGFFSAPRSFKVQ